jgi:hypothetical protein
VLIDIAGMAVGWRSGGGHFVLVFLPDGAVRHAAFALATTGWC